MILNKEQLREEAHNTALSHDPFLRRKPSPQFWRANESDLDNLRSFVKDLRENHSSCAQPAEEWLLDNAEFLEEQVLVVNQQLTKGFVNALPHLNKTGESRVFSICTDYLNHSDGNLHKDSFISYLNAYQEVSVLSIAEVWSLPLIMRVALIRRLSGIMSTIKERRDVCKLVDQLLSGIETSELTPERLKTVLENAGQEMPLSGPMIVHLVKHLRERADYSVTVGEWLICKLENGPDSLDHILSYEYQLQAAYQVTTGNLITSMRMLSRWDWDETFENISMVEQSLRREITGHYAMLDFSSRNNLRKKVEQLARRFRLPENLVATQAVELAELYVKDCTENNIEISERKSFVAYYLLDAEGITLLREALKKCGKPRALPESSLLRRATGTYFNTLAALTIIALVGFSIWLGWDYIFNPFEIAVLVLVLIMPALEWAVAATHWAIERVKQPMPLLRFDFSKGIPEDAKTMVVIPVIWSSLEEVNEVIDRLELHYLANRDPHLHFAILGDFKDAYSETDVHDEQILAVAKKGIERLRYTYPNATFHLLQRKRLWNEHEGVWMGWERKRGKLVEFVELIKGSKETSFYPVDDSQFLLQIRYIITLDSDTQLPYESAHRMIGTVHFPYNRPKLNETKSRVIEGYGVFQPRIGISHESAMKSRFASLWSSEPGIDPYAFAISDPYQDGLEQGIFTGKGIFDVDVFSQVLCERIPENRVLSHDLLEGGFLRAGLLSDIELIDSHPAKFNTYQKRQHRWVRGDWQLLIWLLPKSTNRRGELLPVDLSVLTRWQIIDNLRRSLLLPVLFSILLLAFTILPGSPLRWIALVLATLFLPVIRQLVTIGTLIQNPKSILNTCAQVLVTFVTLPFQIVLYLDGVMRALYRLTFSKKRLLEWVSSSEEDRNSKQSGSPIMFGMLGGYILIGLFFIAAVLYKSPGLQVIGFIFTAIWLLAPFIVHWLNQPQKQEKLSFSKQEEEELQELAKQIWSFYEKYVSREDNWLPPDNVQMEPPNGVAHRTSPTNIGLYLTCALAARDFEFIDTPGLITRVERTMNTIERMEKWEGHLLNWYDTVNLRPLSPKYVSTVDSGNFVGALIAVKEGLEEWLEVSYGIDTPLDRQDDRDSLKIAFSEELTPVASGKVVGGRYEQTDWGERGRQLLERIDNMIQATDFKPLYNHSAKLFSLGYHVERHELDEVLYDLMASEARIASYVAIALGQVSVSHWNALGRTMTKVSGNPVLLSWSGTMFEFLMPWLITKTYQNTLWDTTYRAVVQRQIDYAREREVPFGISESGYYAFDFQMNYQYRAFGVPGLGFKRGLEEDLVIAPYATIMAIPFAKDEALRALKNIEKLDGRGQYGFYEAMDFTPKRLPKNKQNVVIRSFMAHHQGMSMLTLANVLLPKTMIDRFHRNKQVRSAELLLQERVPKKPKYIKHHALSRVHEPYSKINKDQSTVREYVSPHTQVPEVCVLSNSSFTSVVTTTGSGFMQYNGLSVSRWREDPVMDSWGNYIYIRDISTDKLWSPSYQPCQVESTEERVQFGLDHATFMRVDGDVKTCMEVCVSADWNAEVRRISVTNSGSEAKVLEITSFVELGLANPIADVAHTAFSKLFIRTAFDANSGCLVAGRRPREEKDQILWSAHSLIVEGDTLGTIEYETDRSSFIGRGYRLSEPKGIRARLRGRVGSVADPAFVMRRRVSVKPGGTIQLAAVTSVSETREDAIDIIRRFTPDRAVERAFQLAWNRGQIELRNLQLTNRTATDFQTLASRVLYTPPLKEERKQSIIANMKGQSGLWSFGVSGDRPIVLVNIENRSHMPFVVKMLTGHEYLRRLGLLFDLVFLNESEEGYHQNLQEALQQAAEHGVDRFGAGMSGVYVVPANRLTEDDKNLLRAVARLEFRAGGPSIPAQMRLSKKEMELPLPEVLQPTISERKGYQFAGKSLLDETKDWLYFNGWGGFSPDGREYRIILKNGNHLPAPWINVLSNKRFGCIISELGTGYTWWRNSRECKLTPWSNDPVLDPPGETAFLRDERSGEIWSLTPSATHIQEPYKITHGKGFTRFDHEQNGIKHDMTVYVPIDDPVKIIKINLQNTSNEDRKVSLSYYAEWVLGVQRHATAPFIVTEWLETESIIVARNHYQETFREATAFLGVFSEGQSAPELTWTGDRNEFIGRNGTMEHPAALTRLSLSGRTGSHYDPCGAVQTKLELKPNQQRTIYVLLGCEDSQEEIISLVGKYKQPEVCEQAIVEVRQFWDHHLGQIQVSTPSQETDFLLNGWLLYQSLACRMWARTAFFQAGGAFGFRDQLQDSLAVLHTMPERTREQIILHASHQYLEGDVQHWWHEETERGIRTTFSDDLLWMPYAVSRYIEHTGDETILSETAPFLVSEPLKDHEHERYEETVKSSEIGSVYEHCLRAIKKALSRIGEHGLPLIGVGDWNDGMNQVGVKGRGESVWLGWFICDVLNRFMEICQKQGDIELAEGFKKSRLGLIEALNEHGWDGHWYRRAFHDGGKWLGSIENEECRIDAIAQSWSVISGGAPIERATQAMNSFDRELVERNLGVVKLLTPAFDRSEPSPGYIQGYPPGLRENGAQYTHGVIWSIVAWSMLNEGDKAHEMFSMLNPMTHTRTDREVMIYTGEPYAIAADVYTASPNEGHAGWTWYTGASGWLYQAGVEWILGIRRRADKLYINPCIPKEWPSYSVKYRFGNTFYFITVKQEGRGEQLLSINGENVAISQETQPFIELKDDGREYNVELII